MAFKGVFRFTGQRDGGRHAVGRMSVVLQLGHEPDPVRVPLGELQEKLHEGLHLRKHEGGQRGTSGTILIKLFGPSFFCFDALS